jgi:hypothetical protein
MASARRAEGTFPWAGYRICRTPGSASGVTAVPPNVGPPLPTAPRRTAGHRRRVPALFGLVQALARTGRRPEALQLFRTLLEHASPLGLCAEEMDPATGVHLGNYPQTLTHATLIQAALAIRAAGRP